MIMFFENYLAFCHNIGLCFWDLPAVLVAVLMLVMITVHNKRQQKRDEQFEEARKEKLEELKKASGTPVEA